MGAVQQDPTLRSAADRRWGGRSDCVREDAAGEGVASTSGDEGGHWAMARVMVASAGEPERSTGGASALGGEPRPKQGGDARSQRTN